MFRTNSRSTRSNPRTTADLNGTLESRVEQLETPGLFRRAGEFVHRAKETFGYLGRIAGIGAGAMALVFIAPGAAEEVADEAGVELNIPGGGGTAYADICKTIDLATLKCIEWIPSPTPTNPPGGGGGGPATTQPPVTTIPYGQRNPDGDDFVNEDDNCPTVPNNGQEDFDSDGKGDDCDDDADADYLADGLDPNRFNRDVDGDGFVDGDPSEIEDKAGDGTSDILQSRIDIDGDGYSAETGDTDEAKTCVPSNQAPNCDGDGDGLFGTRDGNPEAVFADIDGDGIDDTASADKGGDTDLADGPKGDLDEDGKSNETDKQNQKLKPGEEVDDDGVIIIPPSTTAGDTATTDGSTPSPETDPGDTTDGTEVAGTTSEDTTDDTEASSAAAPTTTIDTASGTGEGINAMTIIVPGLGTLALGTTGVLIWKRKRDEDNNKSKGKRRDSHRPPTSRHKPSRGGRTPQPGIAATQRTSTKFPG